jgi:hypothetical protein
MSDLASAIYDIAHNKAYTPEQAKALIHVLVASPLVVAQPQLPTPAVADKPRNGDVPLGETVHPDGRRATVHAVPPFMKPAPAPLTAEQQKLMEATRRQLNAQAEEVTNKFKQGTWDQ